MSTPMPPIPPANQSPKGGATVSSDDTKGLQKGPGNLDQKGHQGNIHQNTTNQGYQQDR